MGNCLASSNISIYMHHVTSQKYAESLLLFQSLWKPKQMIEKEKENKPLDRYSYFKYILPFHFGSYDKLHESCGMQYTIALKISGDS